MKLLVTGGLGFIGSNFIRHMFSRQPDAAIINVDKVGVGGNLANLQNLNRENSYQFVKGDILEADTMKALVQDVDFIVNFAAETHVDRSIATPSLFMNNNVLGTFTLLEAIRKHGNPKRYVQISTDEVYGDHLQGSSTELDRLTPSNPYSASKASADMLCLAYHRTYGLNVCITRSTNNFGPYQFPEKLIPKTVIRAQLNLSIPIYGTGRNIRDWIYVLDHCEAVSLVLRKGKPGEIYNISSGNEETTIGIVQQILKILDKSAGLVTFVEDRPGHDLRYSLSTSKIKLELGWKPKYDFTSALAETVHWYVKNSWWWQPLADEKILHPTPWKPQ